MALPILALKDEGLSLASPPGLAESWTPPNSRLPVA